MGQHDAMAARVARTQLACWSILTLALVFLGGCRGEPPAPTASTETAVVSAVSPPAAAASSAAPLAVGEPFLWEVRSAKGSTYLFGTMHIGADAHTQLAPVVWDKLAAATTFVMETDVESVSPLEMMGIATLPEGQSLDVQLGPDAWSKVVAATGAFLPEASLKRFKPWFVMVAITQQMLPKTEPMDLVFQRTAREGGKRMLYLEGWQEQIAILDKAMTAELLRDSADELDEVRKRLGDMQRAYLQGDERALLPLVFDAEEMKKYPKLYELTFDQRNAAWLPQLRARIAEGGAFVAVGVGHLVGDHGLVQMLASAGVDVVRLSKAGKARPPRPAASASPSASASTSPLPRSRRVEP